MDWNKKMYCTGCGKEIPRKETLEAVGGVIKCKKCRKRVGVRKKPRDVINGILVSGISELVGGEYAPLPDDIRKACRELSDKIVKEIF